MVVSNYPPPPKYQAFHILGWADWQVYHLFVSLQTNDGGAFTRK
jgi:hypothetical protein